MGCPPGVLNIPVWLATAVIICPDDDTSDPTVSGPHARLLAMIPRTTAVFAFESLATYATYIPR